MQDRSRNRNLGAIEVIQGTADAACPSTALPAPSGRLPHIATHPAAESVDSCVTIRPTITSPVHKRFGSTTAASVRGAPVETASPAASSARTGDSGRTPVSPRPGPPLFVCSNPAPISSISLDQERRPRQRRPRDAGSERRDLTAGIYGSGFRRVSIHEARARTTPCQRKPLSENTFVAYLQVARCYEADHISGGVAFADCAIAHENAACTTTADRRAQ